MAFSGGVYTGIANTFNNASAGTIIDASDWNDLFTDIEAGINAAANGTASFAVTDVASAATTNIGAASTAVVRITGTTTITSLGSVANSRRMVLFAGSLTFTHNATSLILPGGANITTQAGDTCVACSDASGNWRIYAYQTANRTGTGSAVFATSPTLVTPTIGVATATSVNKVTLTAPATASTLTIADGKTLTANSSTTLAGTDGKTLTTNASLTLAGTDGKSLTLTNGLTVSGNDGTISFGAASKALTINNSITFAGTDSTTMTFPATSSTVLTTGNNATITKGYYITPNNLGTVSSGTTTPDAANGNYQYYTNNGAHTLAAPASDSAIDILVTNGASAGVITFSGFTVGSSTGSALTTTNTHRFIISIRRINAISTYSVYALQ